MPHEGAHITPQFTCLPCASTLLALQGFVDLTLGGQRLIQFLRALAREVTDPTLFVRPWRLIPIVVGTSRGVTVDQRLGMFGLARIGLGLRIVASGEAVTLSIPTEGFVSASGASMLRVRSAEADAVFAGLADGSALRPR